MVLQSVQGYRLPNLRGAAFTKGKMPKFSFFEYKRLNEIFEFDQLESQLLENRHAGTILRKFVELESKIHKMQCYADTIQSVIKNPTVTSFLHIYWILEKKNIQVKTRLRRKLARNGFLAKADEQLFRFLVHNNSGLMENLVIPVDSLRGIYPKNNARSEMITLQYINLAVRGFREILPQKLMKVVRASESMYD